MFKFVKIFNQKPKKIMKKLLFIVMLFFATFSCSKSESTPTPVAPTNKISGTWVLTSSLRYIGAEPVPDDLFANNPCYQLTEVTFDLTTSTSGDWSYKSYTYNSTTNVCNVNPLDAGVWTDDGTGTIVYKKFGVEDQIGKNVFSNNGLTRTETTTTLEGGVTRKFVETYNKK